MYELKSENFSPKIISVPITSVWKHFCPLVLWSHLFPNFRKINKPEVSARKWLTKLVLPLLGRHTKTIIHANACTKPHVYLYHFPSITPQCTEPNKGLYVVFDRLFFLTCVYRWLIRNINRMTWYHPMFPTFLLHDQTEISCFLLKTTCSTWKKTKNSYKPHKQQNTNLTGFFATLLCKTLHSRQMKTHLNVQKDKFM